MVVALFAQGSGCLTHMLGLHRHDPSSHGGFGMAKTDQDRRARLDALEARLAEKRVSDAPLRHQDEHHSQVQMAWRMVIELVAGLGIGLGMGYGLDLVFGTTPWLMIIFVLLGFAAGVKTMMRTANEMQTPETSGDETERN